MYLRNLQAQLQKTIVDPFLENPKLKTHQAESPGSVCWTFPHNKVKLGSLVRTKKHDTVYINAVGLAKTGLAASVDFTTQCQGDRKHKQAPTVQVVVSFDFMSFISCLAEQKEWEIEASFWILGSPGVELIMTASKCQTYNCMYFHVTFWKNLV